MGLFDFLKPKWQHSQPEIRRKAIASIDEAGVLEKLSKTDPDKSVRQVASQRLDQVRLSTYKRFTASEDPENDIDELLNIITSASNTGFREAAKTKLVKLLIEAFTDDKGHTKGTFLTN